MEINIESRAELYGYTERRVIVDTHRYSRYLLNMGNIFKDTAPGIYDKLTGDLIVDYIKGGHFVDDDGRRIGIHSWEDFEAATSDVYDHQNRLTVSKRNLKRISVTEKPPIHRLAVEGAAAVYARCLKQNFDHVIATRGLRDLGDIVYIDDVEENPNNWKLLRQMEEAMIVDIDRDLRGVKWKELYFQKRNEVYMVDVALDIRIKDYYERLFDERDREDDRRREREYNGHSISCT